MRKDNLSVQEQLRWSGALGIQDLLRQSPAFQIHNELHQKLFGLQEQLRRSGVFDIQEILRASPAFQLQEQLQYGLFEIREQLRQCGAFPIREALRDSPVLRMHDQLGQGFLGLQEQLRQSAVLDMQEMLPESTAFGLQEQLRRCFLDFQEQFESYGLLGIQNALRNVSAENLLFEISHIQNPLDCLRELAEFINQEEIGNEMLQIGPGGTASLAGETATAAEIELAFRELFDHLKDYLTDIQTRLMLLRKPVRALIGWFTSNLLIPLLVSLYFQQQGSQELREMQRRLAHLPQ